MAYQTERLAMPFSPLPKCVGECSGLVYQPLPPIDDYSNKFSRDGAHHLAGLLHLNPPMKELVLSFNRIEDEGLMWISQAITADNFNLEK